MTVRMQETVPVDFYRHAKKHVQNLFAAELTWQAERDIQLITESDLLREAAWVILCAGFREAIVRRSFSYLSICFCEWESADVICRNSELCRETAIVAFRNLRKIDAIVQTAFHVHRVGFDALKLKIAQDPLPTLQCLPYIGRVTAYHLAKNLGVNIAKPDRHLVRLASSYGFDDVQVFCNMLAEATGDPISVVDLVIWRYLEQHQTDRLGFPPFC